MPIVTQGRFLDPSLRLIGKITLDSGGILSQWDDPFSRSSENTTSYRSNFSRAERRAGVEESWWVDGKDLAREVGAEYRRLYDNGHEFSNLKFIREYSHTGMASHDSVSLLTRPFIGGATLGTYTGGLVPVVGPLYQEAGLLPSLSQSMIDADGTEAINRTIPTAPEAGLVQFLVELKEQIPKLTGTIALKSGLNGKSVSEEYLNREFGQKPFINDLTKFANSMLNANKMVKQYRRDSGRNVRRRTVLGEDSWTNVVTMNDTDGVPYPQKWHPSALSMFADPLPACLIVDNFYSKKWFSGAYTYHVAELDNFLGKLDAFEQQANHLLGTRITPSTVWELTPWSWLVDWFSNFGTIVQNISLLHDDSTVLRYGYVMHETHVTRTRSLTGLRSRETGAVLPTISSSHTIMRKLRTRATPYGFGLNLSSLSPRRWAILGALGMTKGSNSLKLSD